MRVAEAGNYFFLFILYFGPELYFFLFGLKEKAFMLLLFSDPHVLLVNIVCFRSEMSGSVVTAFSVNIHQVLIVRQSLVTGDIGENKNRWTLPSLILLSDGVKLP